MLWQVMEPNDLIWMIFYFIYFNALTENVGFFSNNNHLYLLHRDTVGTQLNDVFEMLWIAFLKR